MKAESIREDRYILAATDKYFLLIYFVHSYFETVRNELNITNETTVENFRKNNINEKHCKMICEYTLSQWDYELSNNQLCNGINLLLKCWASNITK